MPFPPDLGWLHNLALPHFRRGASSLQKDEVQGAWCDPADLDRIFRLRATRVLNRGGYRRFRHWWLNGERGLAGERAAVWVWDETLTFEYATETLAQHRVAFGADGYRLREVDAPRLYATDHASPQPFLSPLDEAGWHPALRPPPYRPRRQHCGEGTQARLLAPGVDAAAG